MSEQPPNPKTTALTTRDPFAIMDALDEKAIMAAFQGQVPEHWVYRFEIDGRVTEGLSAPGVEETARYMAAHEHEVLRELDVHLESETETEGRFVATAARFAISPEGDEIKLDTVIRGKRQPKYIQLRKGGRQFNEHWYEIGVTKAARNAKLALIPDRIKQHVIRLAAKKGKVLTPDLPEATEGATDGACPEHNKPLINGTYGPYCPTKVTGADGKERWCKGTGAKARKAAPAKAAPAAGEPVNKATGEIFPTRDQIVNLGQLFTAALNFFGLSQKETLDALSKSDKTEIADAGEEWEKLVERYQEQGEPDAP